MRPPPPDAVRLGSDLLWHDGSVLHIDAARPCDGWVVSPHRPTLVTWEGTAWRLAGAEPHEKHRVRYRLEPWQDTGGLVGWQANYDLAFVRERDRIALQKSASRFTGPALTVLGPVLGYLWSGTKLTLAQTLGFDPRLATQLSVQTSRLVGILCLAAAFPLYGLSGRHTLAVVLALASVALTVESMMRHKALSKGNRETLGFLEWVFRR